MAETTDKRTKSMRVTDDAPELTGMYLQRLFVLSVMAAFPGHCQLSLFLSLQKQRLTDTIPLYLPLRATSILRVYTTQEEKKHIDA
ncbi:hypothetical protein [Morganella morganii]|uniref:hypothetical protein n=1 Tax=Morganella morganii TaxID=582 RepID=UPI003EC04BF8